MAESYSVVARLQASGAEQFKRAMNDASKSVNGVNSSVKSASGGLKNFMGGVTQIATAIGVTSLIAKGFNLIKSSVSGAVSRVDTLKQYPRILEQMGFGAEAAAASTARLSEGIQGLPTRLNDVVSVAQRFATTFRNVELATETTLALNNALIASGASSQQAASATDQYIKMMSSGKVEMNAWNNLSQNMNYALIEVSKSLGYSETSTWELYEALKSGEVTLEVFNDAMIEASTATGGFADVALTASGGIETSWTNINTAVTSGVANIIQAFDDWLDAEGFGGIAGVLDNIKEAVKNAFAAVVEWIPQALEWFTSLFNAIKNSTAFQIFTDVLGKAVTLIKNIVKALPDLIDKYGPLIVGVLAAVAAYKAFNAAVSIGETLALKGMYAIDGLKGAFSGLTKSATSAASGTGAFSKLLAGLGVTGIGGIAIAGVALLTVGIVAYSMSLDSAYKRLKEFNKAVKENNASIAESKKEVRDAGAAAAKLADEYSTLSDIENKTAADRERMKQITEELTAIYPNLLNFVNQETGLLDTNLDTVNELIKAEESRAALPVLSAEREDLLNREIFLKGELAEAERELADAETEAQRTNSYNSKMRRDAAQETYDDVNELIDENNVALERNNAQYEYNAEIIEGANDIIAESSKEKSESIIKDLEAEEEALKNQRTAVHDHYQEFQRLTEENYKDLNSLSAEGYKQEELTMDDWFKGMTSRREAEYKNQELLAALSGRDIPAAMMEELTAAGPQYNNFLESIVNSSDTKLKETVDVWEGNWRDARTGAMNEIKPLEPEAIAFLKKYRLATGEELELMVAEYAEQHGLSTAAAKTELDEMLDIHKDNIDGITRYTKKVGGPKLRHSSMEMATDAAEGYNSKKGDALKAGTDNADAFAEGVEDNKASADKAGDTLAKSAVDSAKSTKIISSWRTAGVNSAESYRLGVDFKKKDTADAGRSIATNAKDGAGAISMYGTGNNAGSSFVGGIKSQWNSAYNAGYSLGSAAAQGQRNALGIASPSKVAIADAKNLGQTFIDTLLSLRGKLKNASEDFAQAAIPNLYFPDYNVMSTQNVSYDINHSNQPAFINLNLGGRNFEAFVEDITDIQDSAVRLELSYS